MLEALFVHGVFQFLLVLSRIGSAIMVMPGIGGRFVPVNARLLFALSVSAILYPVLGKNLPGVPPDFPGMVILIIGEVLVGLFLGMLVEIMMMALHVAGTVISFQTGLSSALVSDPITESQGSSVTGLLNMLGVLLFFILNLHHVMFEALVESYILFTPGNLPPMSDFSETIVRHVAWCFDIGIRLSAPFIIVNTVLFSGLGILSRLMPQMQVFFVAMPLQLVLGFALMMAAIPAGMMWYMRLLDERLNAMIPH
jgi:flagellar biosynthetic protein FliR